MRKVSSINRNGLLIRIIFLLITIIPNTTIAQTDVSCPVDCAAAPKPIVYLSLIHISEPTRPY